ncbi:MFS general substrate transporter [Delitschia confertaspora ATCC 74209]|uniref:MFS general substrate transporter n=1 Tax=Delitschia confertaspora ATCC 74209 TaxID=1513339 RepID=A0A9P4MUP1_9PLEO|nr:MFS general substrate transporter [Delitschia confertaspora ATCC 74209]
MRAAIPLNHYSSEQTLVDRNGENVERCDTQHAIKRSDAYPDGGVKAWLVVAGAWSLLFVSSGWINCIGIFQAQYEAHQLQHLTSSTIAWIPSLETFVMFASGLPVGTLYDSLGPVPLMFVGTFLHIFGVSMITLSSQYYQILLSQSICSALGASCLFYAALNATTTWFMRRRALALSIVISGASVGGVVLPIMVQQLMGKIGFAWSLRAADLLMLILCIFAIFTVRSRISPKLQRFSYQAYVNPFRELVFATFTCGSFFFFWGMFIPFNYIMVQAEATHVSDTLIDYLVAILNGASLFGRLISGYAADRLGLYNTLIANSLLSALLCLTLWIAGGSSAGVIVSFAAAYGFTSGAFIALAPVCVAKTALMVPGKLGGGLESIGVRQGVYFAAIAPAALTSNPIAGAIRGAQGGGFLGLKIWTGGALLVGTTVLVGTRWAQMGRRWGWIEG